MFIWKTLHIALFPTNSDEKGAKIVVFSIPVLFQVHKTRNNPIQYPSLTWNCTRWDCKTAKSESFSNVARSPRPFKHFFLALVKVNLSSWYTKMQPLFKRMAFLDWQFVLSKINDTRIARRCKVRCLSVRLRLDSVRDLGIQLAIQQKHG